MFEYSIDCFFFLSDQGEDTRLFGCIAVNVSSGNASLEEFPCDTKLTPLCEPGIYISTKTFISGIIHFSSIPIKIILTRRILGVCRLVWG